MSFITQVLLPKRDNFGRTFGRGRYRAFHNRMLWRYGGWTRKGQAEGAWLSLSGSFVKEQHWVYEISHDRADLRFWQDEKERLKKDFKQEEIWIIQYEGRRV